MSMNFIILNDEGMKMMGEIFPDKKVPVKSMVPVNAELEGQPGQSQVYHIDVDSLTEDKYFECLTAMAAKFGEDFEVVKEAMDELGFIPLNAKLVNVSAGELRQFI